MWHLKLILLVVSATISASAYSYLGPGMAGGTIVAVLGIIFSLLLAVLGVIYYPLKRAIKQRSEDKAGPEKNEDQSSELE